MQSEVSELNGSTSISQESMCAPKYSSDPSIMRCGLYIVRSLYSAVPLQCGLSIVRSLYGAVLLQCGPSIMRYLYSAVPLQCGPYMVWSLYSTSCPLQRLRNHLARMGLLTSVAMCRVVPAGCLYIQCRCCCLAHYGIKRGTTTVPYGSTDHRAPKSMLDARCRVMRQSKLPHKTNRDRRTTNPRGEYRHSHELTRH